MYAYQIPEQTGDGWATASLDDVGMDKELLGDLVERIAAFALSQQ
jgi:hypothetical protein